VLINRFSRLLGERRLAIREVSRMTGISYRALFDLYHDKSTRIDLATIDKLCRALGVTPNDLFEFVREPDPAAPSEN
jgi:DNA-binding Xre family transcriptional regulator